MTKLSSREAAHVWLPRRFAHVDGEKCSAAESLTDVQLKGLGHIPAELVAFLRHDALRSDSHEPLRAVASLGRAAARGGVLPSPSREVLAGHALFALLLVALGDAARLDELSPAELEGRTARALTTGSPDSTQVLDVLIRADDLTAYMIGRVHDAYQDVGAKRVRVDIPSLRELATTPPEWVPRYTDLVQKLRANPSVAREILQTSELACFEAILGGDAHLVAAFDHLFTAEHRYLLHVALRCLSEIAGQTIVDPLVPILDLDFTRGQVRADRTSSPSSTPGDGSAQRAKSAADPAQP
ncbi:MAG: hypothetical protein WBG57_03170 [Ornithinimicrobium sp.]